MITQTRSPRGRASRRDGAALAASLRPFLWPLIITGLLVVGALFGPAALSDPVDGSAPADARLEVGWSYLLLAPAFAVLDTLSVLTLDQHYAMLITYLLVFIAWRALRRRRPRTWTGRMGTEAGVALLCLAGLCLFYGFGIVGHRPMARLVVTDTDVLVFDVHSHTHHSHDSRPGFDAERRREWHASAGFHAAYVADHRTWRGYEEGAERNPGRAGLGTVLLPALEIRYAGEYASALGPAWRYRHAIEGNDLVADSIARSVRDGGPRPTLVLTIPSNLDNVPAETRDAIGYVAIEVSDASPRGLKQSRRDRDRILAMADSLDLALVAASNNHGWGRTAPAWTLMRVPGWRELTPQRLSQAVEARLHADRRQATWVLERRAPYPGTSAPALALTGPAITWQMFGGLGAAERIAWLAWVWGLAFLAVQGPRPLRRGPSRGGHPRP